MKNAKENNIIITTTPKAKNQAQFFGSLFFIFFLTLS
jgi:hypothetical protein